MSSCYKCKRCSRKRKKQEICGLIAMKRNNKRTSKPSRRCWVWRRSWRMHSWKANLQKLNSLLAPSKSRCLTSRVWSFRISWTRRQPKQRPLSENCRLCVRSWSSRSSRRKSTSASWSGSWTWLNRSGSTELTRWVWLVRITALQHSSCWASSTRWLKLVVIWNQI